MWECLSDWTLADRGPLSWEKDAKAGLGEPLGKTLEYALKLGSEAPLFLPQKREK
jgi:hypothetical protein